MDKDIIAGKIETLQKEAQARLSTLAQADPVWSNIQGQIGAWNQVLGEINNGGADEDTVQEVGSVGSKGVEARSQKKG